MTPQNQYQINIIQQQVQTTNRPRSSRANRRNLIGTPLPDTASDKVSINVLPYVLHNVPDNVQDNVRQLQSNTGHTINVDKTTLPHHTVAAHPRNLPRSQRFTGTPYLAAYPANTYDASGNPSQDGVYQYLYDAEGRICATSGPGGMTGYLYNAEGERVAKGSLGAWSCDLDHNGFRETAGYVLGPNGEQITEVDGQGAWVHTNG